jgi:hypothetical protein
MKNVQMMRAETQLPFPRPRGFQLSPQALLLGSRCHLGSNPRIRYHVENPDRDARLTVLQMQQRLQHCLLAMSCNGLTGQGVFRMQATGFFQKGMSRMSKYWPTPASGDNTHGGISCGWMSHIPPVKR